MSANRQLQQRRLPAGNDNKNITSSSSPTVTLLDLLTSQAQRARSAILDLVRALASERGGPFNGEQAPGPFSEKRRSDIEKFYDCIIITSSADPLETCALTKSKRFSFTFNTCLFIMHYILHHFSFICICHYTSVMNYICLYFLILNVLQFERIS